MTPDGVLVVFFIESFALRVGYYPSPESEGFSSATIGLLATAVV